MLKQLMLRKKLDEANKMLKELRESVDFETRSSELEEAIGDAKTEEEIRTVEESIDKLEEEKKEYEKEERELEEKIEEIEEELRSLDDKTPKQKEMKRGNDDMELRTAINDFIRSKGSVQHRDVEGFKVVDGGALVPEEFLPAQKEVEDELNLEQYVNKVTVKRGSGKYPVIKKSEGRMHTVAELEKNPELAKPTIDDVGYDIDTYRGYVPVSQEVIDDADYDILGLIDGDIKEQGKNTKNDQIAAILKSAPTKEVTGLDGIVTMFNKDFKRAYNVKAFVSASLFNELDLLKDKNGRYLLQEDITVASGKRIKGREVVVLDDDVIGEADGDLVGFFGDAKAFVTFFDRKQTYVKWVDHNIYGQLLAAFLRFDVKATDTNAGYYVTFTPDEVTP